MSPSPHGAGTAAGAGSLCVGSRSFTEADRCRRFAQEQRTQATTWREKGVQIENDGHARQAELCRAWADDADLSAAWWDAEAALIEQWEVRT